MIGVIVCMRDMSMKQKIDKNSNEASKEVQKEKSLDTTSEEQQRLKLEEETKAIHKQATAYRIRESAVDRGRVAHSGLRTFLFLPSQENIFNATSLSRFPEPDCWPRSALWSGNY